MDAVFFDLYNATEDMICKMRFWFTCQKHDKGFQLLRVEHKLDVHEGLGIMEKEISLRERAEMKKNVLVKKICYYDRYSGRRRLRFEGQG